jgi:hypothetical protein
LSASPDDVARLLRALAEPDPYRANPFRALGLAVLADARETSRRTEGLRVAAELGECPSGWAFAPTPPPSPEAIRAAAHTLRDPPARFICEFFWFWPLTYPAPSPDPALLALAAGDTDTATRLWSEAPPTAAALHNLAVYQHVLCLDWEADPAADPVQRAELRASAAELWLAALAAADLPSLLAARLTRLADPQLPVLLARTLLDLVPGALARTHVRLALRHAEDDRLDDAREQVHLAKPLLPAADAFATLLDEAAAPLAQRLHSGIRTLADSNTPPLDLATALVRSAAPDLLRLQTLLGRSAPAARACARELALAVLDAAIGHQRAGGAEHLVLPHLLYLLDQPASAELARRIVSAFEVMSANAVLAARPADNAPEPTDPVALAELDRELTLRLVQDQLAPAGAEVLALPALPLLGYQARLAAWVVALATAALATGRPEDENWARTQLARALARHPAGTPASERLSTALARLALAESLTLSLAGPANTFSLARAGIALDGRLIPPDELTALRLGPDHSPDGAGRVLLAWSSATEAHALYLDQIQDTAAPDPDLDRRVRDAVDYFLLPPLVARIEAALLAGKHVAIGPLVLTQAGIELETQRLLGSKTHRIPFANAQVHTTTDGRLLVADPAHPILHTPIDPAVTWNALLIPPLLAHFAPTAHNPSA